MREIKFRVWDASEKEMVPWGEVIYDPDDYLVALLRGDIPEDILMQFTGIKDIHGKEIYEGDLVNGIDSQGRELMQPVIWWGSGWYIGYDTGERKRVDSLTSITSPVVIANIYEE